MQKLQDNALILFSGTMAPFPSAVITITNTSGGSSQMYSDNGITPIASTTTDTNGFFSFWCADGKYTINGSGTSGTFTRTDVQIFDMNSLVFKTSPTGSAVIPAGNTAQRDVAPAFGDLRANTDLNRLEWWNGSSWVQAGGGASGGVTDAVFYNSDAYIKSSYTIGSEGLISGAIFTNGSPNIVLTGHNFEVNQTVFFETNGTLPTNFTPDNGYWVYSVVDANTFTVGTSQGAGQVTAGSAGTGTHSCGKIKNAITPGSITIGNNATITVPTGSTWTIP